MLEIKQRVGKACMNVTTKSLEFVSIIYGGPGSKIIIVVLYVCQACGWAPKFECEYYVIPGPKGTQNLNGSYCCEIYDKFVMNGAFGLIFKDK